MRLKLFLFFLLPAMYVFPAKIGLICYSWRPFNSALEHPNELIKSFQDQGHTAEMVYYDKSSMKALNEYDILLTILNVKLTSRLKKKTIVWVLEPRPVCRQFSNVNYLSRYHKVFTWNHDLYDGKQFFKTFFPLYEGVQPSFKPFEERTLTCLISGYLANVFPDPKELYTARKDIAEFYTSNCPEKFNLYGSRGWDTLGLSTYKGRCQNKHTVLRDHKFCYCYENWENDYHYISEKIFHCFQNRCVPIYHGSSKITDYVPKEAFIDARDFGSVEELHNYIDTMSEERWMEYMAAIERYDRSMQSNFFRLEYYLETVSNVVNDSLQTLNK